MTCCTRWASTATRGRSVLTSASSRGSNSMATGIASPITTTGDSISSFERLPVDGPTTAAPWLGQRRLLIDNGELMKDESAHQEMIAKLHTADHKAAHEAVDYFVARRIPAPLIERLKVGGNDVRIAAV